MNDKRFFVSEIISKIKYSLEKDFKNILIEGEVSNLTRSNPGHWYFSLKDKNSILNCVLFKMSAYRNSLVKNLKNGDQIICMGNISVYEPRGTFQLIIEKIVPVGEGILKRQFEIMKKNLEAEGLFAKEVKKRIPLYPKKIAVITSPQGAAINDFLNIFKRRSIWMDILIVPSVVQGIDTSESVINAMKKIEEYNRININKIEIIVITRGGGSIEDLWGFNEEDLVRKIFMFEIPVISAIGHEVDYTISDFVSDLRCETPSAAAEILTESQMSLKNKMQTLKRSLMICFKDNIKLLQNKVEDLSPISILDILLKKFFVLKTKLLNLRFDETLGKRILIDIYRMSVEKEMSRGVSTIKSRIMQFQLSLKRIDQLFKALNPNNVLKRGYTIIKSKKEIVEGINSFNDFKKNAEFDIHFHDGIGKVRKE